MSKVEWLGEDVGVGQACPVTSNGLQAWGAARNYAVFGPYASALPSWFQLAATPGIASKKAVIAVRQDGTFWAYVKPQAVGTNPVPVSATAARADYCAFIGPGSLNRFFPGARPPFARAGFGPATTVTTVPPNFTVLRIPPIRR